MSFFISKKARAGNYSDAGLAGGPCCRGNNSRQPKGERWINVLHILRRADDIARCGIQKRRAENAVK
jgi:hypothetical protein